jgi:putative DNA primase/helicase
VTGGDVLPFERKGKDALAPFVCNALVLIAANAPLTTTDTAVPRRRITMPFIKSIPNSEQRTLLQLNTEEKTLSGEFEPCIPGLLNWILAMSDAEMVCYIKDTDRAVPSLAAVKSDTLLAVNPMAAWVDAHCVLLPDVRTGVGVAKKVRASTGGSTESRSWESYDNADYQLYPSYREYCDRAGQTAVSMRLFSERLHNLITDQLKYTEVKKGTDRVGSYFIGIAVRNDAHKDLPRPISGGGNEVTAVIPITDFGMPRAVETLPTGEWDAQSQGAA